MMDIKNRIIGSYATNKKGPLLFITAGIHGNEPSGIAAFERVLKVLVQEQPIINGTVVGVRGNTSALEENKRYIDEDLNRTWTKTNIQNERRDSSEKKEMFEIIALLDGYRKNAADCYFLDCHTTSSQSLPYISVQDVGHNDPYAHQFPTYIIRGFSDIVNGCVDHYLSREGLTGFVFEAGQHTSSMAVNYHEAMIWLALSKACHLDLNALSRYPVVVTDLNRMKDNQKTMEIIYRHELLDSDSFAMEPGYENFQPIVKGELLAIHNGKKIHSKWDAFIFMPLYQSQGNDGFFVVEATN